MEIRSYRSVFDLERRIYRIDRLRLNPGGVPVRGIVYFLALLGAILLARRAPLLGDVAGALPWYVLYVALPGASAALLTVVRIEGRPSHLAAWSLGRYRFGRPEPTGLRVCRSGSPGALDGPDGRWYPQEVLLLPDGSDRRMRRLRYTGPGAVLVSVAHSCEGAPGGRLGGLVGRLPIAGAHVRLCECPGTGADAQGDDPGSDATSGTVIALAAKARMRVG
jgi:hypothetical protein